MRERIKDELSENMAKTIIVPETILNYKVSFKEMILLNKAYALMLAKTGIVDKESVKKILEGLAYVEETLKPEDLSAKFEDLYFNVEKVMIDKIGGVGGKIHAGRSRNDINTTNIRMEIRKTVWPILDELVALQELLIQKAEENKDAVMTGYTHFQPGQPITLGHYYMAFYKALVRDFYRIKNAYDNLNICPFGAAALAGTSFPVDRQMLCDLLGFDEIMENSLDCIASRDYMLQLLSAYAIMSVNFSRIAEDMDFWATFENGIFDVPGEIACCSSIMPQKKNPVAIEYIKGKSAHSVGALVSSIVSTKGISYSNNMDVYEATTFYWEGLDQLKQMMCAMKETVTYATLRRDVAAQKAAENYCTVTSLADLMVKDYGLSFRDAHHIVGTMVGIIIENGSGIKGITPELVKQESKKLLGYELDISAEEIHSMLDPFKNVQSKQGIGGPSTESVEKMIQNAKVSLKEENAWLKGAKDHVQSAYAKLEAEVAKF